MIRATTPTHSFELPIDSSIIDKFRLTYVQDGVVVLRKTEKDMQVVGNAWRIMLTQAETKLFKACLVDTNRVDLSTCALATAQIRIRTFDGRVLGTAPITVRVHPISDEEEL